MDDLELRAAVVLLRFSGQDIGLVGVFTLWKVQLLRDIGNGEELSHPIWAMNKIEEEILEIVLMDNMIFSKEDLEQANTPAKDRLRRKIFLKQK